MGENNGVSIFSVIPLLRHIKGIKPDVIEVKPCIVNKQFPWIGGFSQQCWNVAQQPTAAKLEALVTELLKHLDRDITQCYTRPKRAHNLKQDVNSFLKDFSWMFIEINKSLDHTLYLDKVSDILAHYIDLELKSSRIGKEPESKVPRRIITILNLLLDHSTEHMIDAVLKAKFTIKKYGELCAPVLAKLLEEIPREMVEETYIRYILAFKLWKRLAGREDYARINRLALDRLVPPPGFLENLKSGFYSNILPQPSRSEKGRITSTFFLMQSAFSVKKKAQVFLRERRKIQTCSVIDQPIFNEDFQVTPFFGNDTEESPELLLSEIWENINKDANSIDDLLYKEEKESGNESQDWLFGQGLEFKRGLDNATAQLPKRKSTSVGSCVGIKMDPTLDLVPMVGTSENSKLMLKTEDVVEKSNLCFDERVKTLKPCATVEPACSSENRISEIFASVSIKPQTTDPDPTQDMVIEVPSDTVDSSDVIIIDDDEPEIELPDKLVENEVVGSDISCNYLFSVEGNTSGEITQTNAASKNEIAVETDILPQTMNTSTPLSSPNNIQFGTDTKTSPTTGLPEQIFTSENIENNTTLDLRQDSFVSNQCLISNVFSNNIQHILSDVNTEESDEDVPHHRHAVSGGKVAAFSAQMDEEMEEFDTNSQASSQSLSEVSSENHPSPSVSSQTPSQNSQTDLQPRVMIQNISQDLINQSNLGSTQHKATSQSILRVRDISGMVNSSLVDKVVTDQRCLVPGQPLMMLCQIVNWEDFLPPPQTKTDISAVQEDKCSCLHKVDNAKRPRLDAHQPSQRQPELTPNHLNNGKINFKPTINPEDHNDRIDTNQPKTNAETQTRIINTENHNGKTKILQPKSTPENVDNSQETINRHINPENHKPILVLPPKKRKTLDCNANHCFTLNEKNNSLRNDVSTQTLSTISTDDTINQSQTQANKKADLRSYNDRVAPLKVVSVNGKYCLLNRVEEQTDGVEESDYEQELKRAEVEESDYEQELKRAHKKHRGGGKMKKRSSFGRTCKSNVKS